MYHFLLHPFGRDRRADPLGSVKGDSFYFDPELSKAPDPWVSANMARGLASSPEQKEFAREMLMLPLSVKNPYTPLMGKRSKKILKPPRKDGTYHLTGPERFLDLSTKETKGVEIGARLESGFDQAPNLENTFDKILNCIPFYGFGYYRHPSYNYGPRYAAATGSPNTHNGRKMFLYSQKNQQ